MAATVCRWGILGAANIARKNWKAIRLAENATLTAVASREPARAKEWLDANQGECPFPAGDDLLKNNVRVSREMGPLGALGDAGLYNIRFSLFVMTYARPVKVSGRVRTAHAWCVPLEFNGELFWPVGVSASFYCSFNT